MKLFLQRKVILKGKEKKMEQSKWVIVRRETGFEKFKRSIKNIRNNLIINKLSEKEG